MARQVPQRSEQLAMFMTAREINDRFQPSDWDRDKTRPRGEPSRMETDSEVMDRKLTESKSPDYGGLYGSIEREGVKSPIHLSHQFAGTQRRGGLPAPGRPEIAEGHHRVAATLAINPDRYIPVMHHETKDDAGMYILDNE